MRKLLTLLFVLLLALVSLSGYLFLNKEIIAGNMKIAAGKVQLKEGEQMLKRGKARLASGKRELSQSKSVYNKLNSAPVMAAVTTALPAAWVVAAVGSNKVAGEKISEGEQQVSAGEKKVKHGEEQLETGKQELSQGMERLHQAEILRKIFGIGSIIFTCLFIVLGFCWRKTLFHPLKRRKV